MLNYRIFIQIKPVVLTTSLLIYYRKELTFLPHLSPSYFNFLFRLGFFLATEFQLTLFLFIRKVTNIYRPISLTSIVIKVMERIIHCQLLNALEANHLISNFQHGFRHQHSTILCCYLLFTTGHLF